MVGCELEANVWRMVHSAFDAPSFVRLIEDAVDSYKRAPGLDSLARLHASDIGLQCVQVVRSVLECWGINAGLSLSYVEMRYRLKTHLTYQLQWHLVNQGLATEEMKVNLLGKDLGL